MIAEKLPELVRMRARVPVIFSIQETRSWDVHNLELLGDVCYGGKLGLTTFGGIGSVLQSSEIVEVRREMYSGSVWNHSGADRLRSRLCE